MITEDGIKDFTDYISQADTEESADIIRTLIKSLKESVNINSTFYAVKTPYLDHYLFENAQDAAMFADIVSRSIKVNRKYSGIPEHVDQSLTPAYERSSKAYCNMEIHYNAYLMEADVLAFDAKILNLIRLYESKIESLKPAPPEEVPI